MAIKKQKNKVSEITINGLAAIMQDGFKKQDNKIDSLFKKQEKITDEKIDDLAGMVKCGFDATSKEIGGVREDLAVVKEKVGNIENFIFQQQNPRIKEVEKRLYHIEEILMLDK